ncbi:LysM domain-containing protein [Desulfotomaculum arcticum]|uniref:LysM domain-containing protein n=1 Tax=Desulfotruncus arcticus DSM 17038 TaxID=1121424 RepID=A0A1I2U832_9FIRM|nr:LysM peptidoglycan-binding domain-containing protein [Desulfotruncus arcticus]SFG72549.1 LysM domain-containing protein [Desulfotomaculum arcticum] [Desulfotruncus arcticus DSM 17038]
MASKQVPCVSGRYRSVKPGDTLYTIARETGTTLDILTRLNPGIDPLNLQVGQMICLPEVACASGIYWIVAPGDTLHLIAQSIGTTVARLLELNPNIDPSNLQENQTICLPE